MKSYVSPLAVKVQLDTKEAFAANYGVCNNFNSSDLIPDETGYCSDYGFNYDVQVDACYSSPHPPT